MKQQKTAKKLLLCLLLACCSGAGAQPALLQSGPMVGYAEMREVLLWVQTKQPARVRFIYWDKANPKLRHQTETVQTQAHEACTAKLAATTVEPGRRYAYELLINGERVSRPYPFEFETQPLWQWRGDPPNFSVALGSCNYVNEPPYDRPGTPYGGDYKIFSAIHALRPNAMLWLGDNVYLREADWNTRSGILRRYTHTRSTPEMQPLLASTHHYAIWDDHDYGPNDSNRSFWNKAASTEAFRRFWPNPGFGVGDAVAGERGVTTSFRWGDAEFFLLDDRTFRAPNERLTGERTMIGREQKQWLLDALSTSRATWKFVAIGSQVLNPARVFETYANTFPAEREELIESITNEKIKGVLFLTGDRHHTEFTMLPRAGTYPLYELTVSALTSGPRNVPEEANTLRVPATYVGARNFGMLTFSGTARERTLRISIHDVAGKVLWTREIKATELQ
jgi:alkaline phosphatase D